MHGGQSGERAAGSLGAGAGAEPGGLPGASFGWLLLILAFSGGGTRAAAFAYGILEELAATQVVLGGQSRRLLDEVDLISSVSGGSFTAAYYGLYGDRIFRDFETDFLRRPVERELFVQLLRPYNWVRLASPFFNRSRLAAEYYDEHLFKGATFADLERQPGPGILINATDCRPEAGSRSIDSSSIPCVRTCRSITSRRP